MYLHINANRLYHSNRVKSFENNLKPCLNVKMNLCKLGIVFNLIKSIYGKPIANTVPNGKILEAFHLKLGQARYSSHHWYLILLYLSSKCKRQEKSIAIYGMKRENKMVITGRWNHLLCSKPRETTDILLDIGRNLERWMNARWICKKSVVSAHTGYQLGGH